MIKQISETQLELIEKLNDGAKVTPIFMINGEWQLIDGTPFNLNSEDVDWLYNEEIERLRVEKATQQFRADRQKALDTAVVTSTLSNQYDADEQSLLRMGANIKAGELAGKQDADMVQWSLADTDTGVMTDVPFSDLKEAYILAAANMGEIWGRT